MFSSEGKDEFGRLVDGYKKKRIYKGIASALFLIAWIIITLIIVYNIYITFSDVLNILMGTFLGFIIAFPPLLLFGYFIDRYNSKLENKLEIEKVNLFKEHKITGK